MNRGIGKGRMVAAMKVKVAGMHCVPCVRAVQLAVGQVTPEVSAVVDLNAGIVSVDGDLDEARVVEAIGAGVCRAEPIHVR